MYFRVTKSFLRARSKENLLDLFPYNNLSINMNKEEIITEVFKERSRHQDLGPCDIWISICPYCRNKLILIAPTRIQKNPQYCVNCGKISPYEGFESNLSKASELIILASKMNQKNERTTKALLLEQSLVNIITSLEVFLRDIYSLIYDIKHVLVGNPVYEDVYKQSRNTFINLGSATRALRQVSLFNMKKSLSPAEYCFLSKMFSTRHIIVHNCSTKDKEYISQTGEPNSEVGKKIKLLIPDIRKLISINKILARKLNKILRESIIEFQELRFEILR